MASPAPVPKPRRLPTPAPGRAAAEAFVTTHLAHLVDRRVAITQPLSSSRYRGGQRAADAALARFRVDGYARGAGVAYPQKARSGSGLSPWVRNGLLDLGRLWAQVADGSPLDVAAFRRSLLRLERARLAYAEAAATSGVTGQAVRSPTPPGGNWDRKMGCVDIALDELEDDGWLPAPARRWLAGLDPATAGADDLFRHLLDGSRSVSRPASATAEPASRWRIERDAPGLCASCELVTACPIDHALPISLVPGVVVPVQDDAAAKATDYGPDLPPLTVDALGPDAPMAADGGSPEAVWLTAESMGDADPALAAHPDLPAVFVFDEPLLGRLRLAPRRLVFLAEHLSDLATRRPVELWLGSPPDALAGRQVAATFTPVPGWHRHGARIRPVIVYPWPWLGRQLAAMTMAGESANAIAVMKTGGSQFPHVRPIDQRQPSATESSTGRNIGALV